MTGTKKYLPLRRPTRAGARRQPSLEVQWSAEPGLLNPTFVPVFAVVMLLIAAGCFVLSYFLDRSSEHSNLRNFGALIAEHTGIAFLVALIIGATYELFLHERREKMVRRLFDEHREKMFEALKVHLLLTPEQIFDFIGEIAIQTDETPTLYRPPRGPGEYTFANSIGYFNILMELRRKEIVSVLRRWIDPKSHPHLKFLASDFIGMYKLDELTRELQAQANLAFDHLDENNRWWAFNYKWAVSRCENPPYGSLAQMLINTEDLDLQEWILFVPLQMQEKEFVPMIDRFLVDRRESIATSTLASAARALAALQRAAIEGARDVLDKHASLFAKPEVVEDVRNYWSDLGLPQSLMAGTSRRRATQSTGPQPAPDSPRTQRPSETPED